MYNRSMYGTQDALNRLQGVLEKQIPYLRAIPHNSAPYWQGHRHKYLQRVKLRDLIDRWDIRRPIILNNYINNINNAVPPSGIGGAAYDDQLDRLADALREEMAWRSGWLDNPPKATITSATEVDSRNTNRNLPMR